MKASNTEVMKRVEELTSMLIVGESRETILQNCSEKWGLSERQIDTYISKARTLIEESIKRNVGYDYAKAVRRNEELYRLALEAKDYRLAVQVNKEIANLQGLYKMQVEHSGNVQFICNLPE